MKIKIDSPKKSFFTTTNIILILLIANVMFTSVVAGYVSFSNQVVENTQQSIKDIAENAIIQNKKIIDNQNENSERISESQEQIRKTQEIQNKTNQRNLIVYGQLFLKIANNTDSLVNLTKTLNNNTNQNNQLIQFLSDNFGSQSGYLERENFQYGRANQTFDMITALYNNLTKD